SASVASSWPEAMPIEAPSTTVTPVLVINTGVTVVEGASIGIASGQLDATDADTPNTALAYSVIGAPAHGRLEFIAAPGVAITSFTQDDLDNNRIQYVHDGGEVPTDVFTFRLHD